MGIDVAAWWRPTAANYFGRVKKSVVLDAMTTIGGPELAGRYASAKKADLAEAADKLCGGKTIVEAHVRVAAMALGAVGDDVRHGRSSLDTTDARQRPIAGDAEAVTVPARRHDERRPAGGSGLTASTRAP